MLECAANLACVGAEPLGLTNCLNFGNPEKPHVAWQLTEAVRGLGDACRALDMPVVGGNVSLYNESGGGPIYPTPVVGMVGKLPDAARVGARRLRARGRHDRLLRRVHARAGRLGAGQAARRGAAHRAAARATSHKVRAAHEAVRESVRAGELSSAHDVAEGGLLVAHRRVVHGRGARGATVDPWPDSDPLLWLFGECPGGGFVVSGPREAIDRLAERTPLTVFGTRGRRLAAGRGPSAFEVSLDELNTASARWPRRSPRPPCRAGPPRSRCWLW